MIVRWPIMSSVRQSGHFEVSCILGDIENSGLAPSIAYFFNWQAPIPSSRRFTQRTVCRNLKALAMTLTEDRAIAAAAITGVSRMPKVGYSTPAAIGTPTAL